MTYLRHAPRHIQQTILDRIKAGLTADGWFLTGGNAPTGAEAVKWQPTRMKESELVAATGNLVAVSFGAEPDEIDQELGGGTQLISHGVFIDVIGEDDSRSLAIASDIKDRLTGLMPTTSRFEPVYDYTVDPKVAAEGYLIEFTGVQRIRPENQDLKRLWNVIAASADVYFLGNE